MTTQAQILLYGLHNDRARRATNLTNLLDYALEALGEINAEPDQRRPLRDIVTTLHRVRTALADDQFDYSTVSALRRALVMLRFIRQPNDEPDATNPLFNVTIWLAEAACDSGGITASDDTVHTAVRLGITTGPTPLDV